MVLFAHQDGDPRMIIGEVKLRFSAQTFSQGMHGGPDGLARQTEPLQTPLDPAEKQTSASIRVMVGVMNVASVCSHPSSELTDESRTIRADQLQDCRWGNHGEAMARDPVLTPASVACLRHLQAGPPRECHRGERWALPARRRPAGSISDQQIGATSPTVPTIQEGCGGI